MIGYIIALFFEGLVILFKWIASVYREQSSRKSEEKQFKGVVGQIDDLGRTPFVTQNAALSRKNYR